MTAASPTAGKISPELREKVAKALYEHNGGTDEYDWEDAPEIIRLWTFEEADVAIAALGLEKEENTDTSSARKA